MLMDRVLVKTLAALMAFGMLLVACSLVFGQTPVRLSVPITVECKAGEIARLDSKFTGETEWYKPEALRSETRHYEDKAQKRLIIVPPAAGKYVVIAFGSIDNRPVYQEFVVVAGGVPPVPPPGPDPVPPVPETFAAKIKAAYQADVAAGKGNESQRRTLAAVFGNAGPFVDNTGLKTVGDVFNLMSSALKDVMPEGSLPTVRVLVGDKIAATVPEGPSVALTPDIRNRFKSVFAEITSALEAAK